MGMCEAACEVSRVAMRGVQVVAGVVYRTGDGQERTASAHLTIVCDGMYSLMRKRLSEPKVNQGSPHMARCH